MGAGKTAPIYEEPVLSWYAIGSFYSLTVILRGGRRDANWRRHVRLRTISKVLKSRSVLCLCIIMVSSDHIECPHCFRKHSVKAEHIIRGRTTLLIFRCAACEYQWQTERLEGEDTEPDKPSS